MDRSVGAWERLHGAAYPTDSPTHREGTDGACSSGAPPPVVEECSADAASSTDPCPDTDDEGGGQERLMDRSVAEWYRLNCMEDGSEDCLWDGQCSSEHSEPPFLVPTTPSVQEAEQQQPEYLPAAGEADETQAPPEVGGEEDSRSRTPPVQRLPLCSRRAMRMERSPKPPRWNTGCRSRWCSVRGLTYFGTLGGHLISDDHRFRAIAREVERLPEPRRGEWPAATVQPREEAPGSSSS